VTTLETARDPIGVTVLHVSGDQAWADEKNAQNQPNVGNIVGRIEIAKHIAGCAAALGIGDEQGRLPRAARERREPAPSRLSLPRRAALLAALLEKKPVEPEPNVAWIGFWFNIPGVTLDPTQVAGDFFPGRCRLRPIRRAGRPPCSSAPAWRASP
jgi:simple sugar transport system substrate-binding protein